MSPRRRRIAGTCTLYRNTGELNRLFLADRKFEHVVRERENIRYDEKNWSRFVRKQADNGTLRVYWSKWMQPRGLVDSVDGLYWERGAVFDGTDRRLVGPPAPQPVRVSGRRGAVPGLQTLEAGGAMPCDFGYEDDPQRFSVSPSGIRAEPSLAANCRSTV